MHFWGGTKNPHHLSFSPESTLLFPITSPLLPGSPRSAEHQFSRSACFFVLSFHHALFSHPPGDDAEQRSPWGLATLYVSLRLHHALVRWWVGEGRVSTGTRQLCPGLLEQTGLLDEPQVSAATPEPPPACRGPQREAPSGAWGCAGDGPSPRSGERKEAAGRGGAEGECCCRHRATHGV